MADPVHQNLVRSSGAASASPNGQRRPPAGSRPDTSFAKTLAQAGQAAPKTQAAHATDLKFSNHAQKRLENRAINLTDDGLARLVTAVEKAEKRGGRESLVLMDDLAFIINVKERTVVTALDARSRGEGVFTQIDSVVFAEESASR